MTQFLHQESTVLASCYSVESTTSNVHGFHYCTTLGAGASTRLLTSHAMLMSLSRSTVVSLRSPRGLNRPS